MKEKYQISFSGGRTSGYMTKMLIDNFSDQYDFIVTFANTGMKHNKTLEFVHSCDVHFGFRTVWLKTVVHAGRTAYTHKVVDFDSASRHKEPYQAVIEKYDTSRREKPYQTVIEKYDVPNVSFPYYTREMKLNPMRSYLKTLGINHKDLKTAVGIRADEKRRVSKTATEFNIVYPLIDIWPTDKQDVWTGGLSKILTWGLMSLKGIVLVVSKNLCANISCKWNVTPDRDEAIANAYLIAAAPDLLAACYAVLHDCDDLDMVESNEPGREKGPWQMLKEAIAKATRANQ